MAQPAHALGLKYRRDGVKLFLLFLIMAALTAPASARAGSCGEWVRAIFGRDTRARDLKRAEVLLLEAQQFSANTVGANETLTIGELHAQRKAKNIEHEIAELQAGVDQNEETQGELRSLSEELHELNQIESDARMLLESNESKPKAMRAEAEIIKRRHANADENAMSLAIRADQNVEALKEREVVLHKLKTHEWRLHADQAEAKETGVPNALAELERLPGLISEGENQATRAWIKSYQFLLERREEEIQSLRDDIALESRRGGTEALGYLQKKLRSQLKDAAKEAENLVVRLRQNKEEPSIELLNRIEKYKKGAAEN